MAAFHLPTAENFVLRLFDIQGRLVFSQQNEGVEGDNTLPIQLDGLPEGVYMLDLQAGKWHGQKQIIVK
ncbi:MAG: T9SS type A sorting domain-containing protein, partial [Saprospiraceae bacterium]|nr:T9SS type A sorting domain-containing protein [Saprospiraceae bacterium]